MDTSVIFSCTEGSWLLYPQVDSHMSLVDKSSLCSQFVILYLACPDLIALQQTGKLHADNDSIHVFYNSLLSQ